MRLSNYHIPTYPKYRDEFYEPPVCALGDKMLTEYMSGVTVHLWSGTLSPLDGKGVVEEYFAKRMAIAYDCDAKEFDGFFDISFESTYSPVNVTIKCSENSDCEYTWKPEEFQRQVEWLRKELSCYVDDLERALLQTAEYDQGGVYA